MKNVDHFRLALHVTRQYMRRPWRKSAPEFKTANK